MSATADNVAAILAGLPQVEPVEATSNLPAAFWEARPILGHIRQAAHHRARSADAVLAFVLARAAAATPPSFVLPPIVGARGSLNFAAALIGPPGVGKSTAKRIGTELVDLDHDGIVDDVPVGSGEGLIESYFQVVDEKGDDGKKVKVKRQTKRAVFAYLDEGQALAELGGRKGSTLLPTLRSAWTGDTLGQANASEDRRRRLAAGAYRLAVVIGYQPEHAATLIDDATGGTPQRFLWLSADDPNVPYEPPPWPGRLPWSPPPGRAYAGHDLTTELDVPASVVDEVRHAAIARTRGEEVVDTLDAHHDLARLKVAALLGILEDRAAIDLEDWELAEVVMAVSCRVRGAVIHHARTVERAKEEAGHRVAGRREVYVDGVKANSASRRMAEAIGRHVHRGNCDGPCRRRCLSRSTRSSDRSLASIDEALILAEGEGWIEAHGDTYRPGSARPA